MYPSKKVVENIRLLSYLMAIREFLKVPFGLCNSPAVFQKFIQAAFREVIVTDIARTYLEDIIVLANDVASAIENLKTVLNVASQYGLLINWSKCNLLRELSIWAILSKTNAFSCQKIKLELL